MEEVSIEQIRHELTWILRQKVLYPDSDMYDMGLEEDLSGIHFGAFKGNRLVGVVSLFQTESDFQFRKFAVDPAVQNMGIGSLLLHYITEFAIAEGCKRLWCNARLMAIPFYVKHDFLQTGKLFTKGDVNYETMEKYIE